MDIDKLKQWIEIAQNMQGGEFWNNIFDQEFTRQFLNEQPLKASTAETEKSSAPKKSDEPSVFPIIDIMEGDQEVMIIIELPGIKKEDIELGLAGNILTVKGTSKPFHPHLNRSYSERYYGDFQRQINLPDVVPPSKLSAKFWNGLLFVSYPRTFTKVEITLID